MNPVNREEVLRGLKPFQRDAVAHVMERFYGPEAASHSGRFLIADETGLGKSIIARGIIAETIHELEQDDAAERINIIYICSNQDLAQQNLRSLNVTGQDELALATRLSLLAAETSLLKRKPQETAGGKPVSLVSFTPGTSFNKKTVREGSAPERALLALLLDRVLVQTEEEKQNSRTLLQGQ